jgi:hypothetical protein
MVPTLVIIQECVVSLVLICKDKEQLEAKFKEHAKRFNFEVTDDDLDNGYIEFSNGSICMSWAERAVL